MVVFSVIFNGLCCKGTSYDQGLFPLPFKSHLSAGRLNSLWFIVGVSIDKVTNKSKRRSGINKRQAK